MNANHQATSVDFEQVLTQEQQWIKTRRESAGLPTQGPVIGLAFSGGGIRSASFHLGILQALIARKSMAAIDYLSSVSGGGYIAHCWHYLNHRRSGIHEDPFARATNEANTSVLQWLRAHGKYLVDGKSTNLYTLAASILAGTLFNLLTLLPFLLVLIWLLSLPILPLDWPPMLQVFGSQELKAHSGFLLIGAMGCLSFLLFLISVPLMTFWQAENAKTAFTHNFKHRQLMGRLLQISVTTLAISIIPLIARLEDWIGLELKQETLANITGHLTYVLPLLGGGLAAFRKKLDPKIANVALASLLYGLLAFTYHVVNHTSLMQHMYVWVWCAAAPLLLWFAPINTISMHSYYAHQLARAFFPALKEERAELAINMSDIKASAGSAYPIVNTTLSAADSQHRLTRERLGINFAISPLYTGAPETGFVCTEFAHNGDMSLAQSMTTSAAAVDPDYRETANPVISFFMALLNIRLGLWTIHPRYCQHRKQPIPYRLIWREALRQRLTDQDRYVHLSDGGHFDNLAVYELLRRRCSRILVGDAGADPDMTLSDLGSIIQRAYADFGAQIDIDTQSILAQKNKRSEQCYAIGRIHYADGSQGIIIYIKSVLITGLNADLGAFAATDSSFPNDSTANQFFNEAHFDAYRALGHSALTQLFTQHNANGLSELFDKLEKPFAIH